MAKNNTVDNGRTSSRHVTVTPSDSTTFSPPFKGIYVGTTGDVAIADADGTINVFSNVPVGTHPWGGTKIMSTDTTASDIIALL